MGLSRHTWSSAEGQTALYWPVGKRFDQRPISHIINCIPVQEDQILLDNYSEDDGTLLNLTVEDDSDDVRMAQGQHSAADFVQQPVPVTLKRFSLSIAWTGLIWHLLWGWRY